MHDYPPEHGQVSSECTVRFEAKSIQHWIGAGDKLLDLAGGSEILERLVMLEASKGGYLGDALKQCGLDAHHVVSSASARIELSGPEDGCRRFCQLWPLIMQTVAPGLRFDLEVKWHGSEVTPERYGDGAASALFGPLTERSARTGGVAVRWHDEGHSEGEMLDASTTVRRSVGRRIDGGGDDQSLLISKLRDDRYTLTMLRDADALSEGTEDREGRRALAYVHADVSGLSGIYDALNRAEERVEITFDLARRARRTFSTSVNEVTTAAAREAFSVAARADDIFKARKPPPVEARPVLVGGDDLTVILPARIGYVFAVAYLRAFSRLSSEVRPRVLDLDGALHKVLGEVLPEQLPVGCGVAYVHPHFPASRAIGLAGSLCDWAKKAVGRSVSCLAFHRLTASTVDDYAALVEQELTRAATLGEGKIMNHLLTAGPYLLERVTEASQLVANSKGFAREALPCAAEALGRYLAIEDLDDLVRQLASDSFPRGAQRDVLDLAYEDPSEATARLLRMREVASKSETAGHGNAIASLCDGLVLDGFRDDEGRASVWKQRTRIEARSGALVVHDQQRVTPFGDVHALLSVARRPGSRARPVLY